MRRDHETARETEAGWCLQAAVHGPVSPPASSIHPAGQCRAPWRPQLLVPRCATCVRRSQDLEIEVCSCRQSLPG